MQSLEDRHGLAAAKDIYQRRLQWLLAAGLLHGALLWFGDILTAYALTGFWLLGRAGAPIARNLLALKIVVIVNLGLLLLTAIIMATIAGIAEYGAETAVEAMRANDVYAHGGWSEVGRARLHDFAANIGGFVLFVPRIALLFLLGVLAVQLGWLTRPGEHRAVWRRILAVGVFIALPFNLWWGYAALGWALDPEAPSHGLHAASFLLELAGPALAAAYVAVFMLVGDGVMNVLARWLAPVGRMALTNYLMQSVVCGLLLHAYGLGLGASLRRAQLMTLCAAVMLLQVAFSHWWLARRDQGPVEALWRRYTYRR